MVDLENKYIFAICNYGGAAAVSIRILRQIIRRRGGKLSAAFGVLMMQNSFKKPFDNLRKLSARWEKRRRFIVGKLQKRAKGTYYANWLLELLMAPMYAIVIKAACVRAFSQKTGLPANTPLDQLIRHLDCDFHTTEDCTGCGLCVKICPVQNIRLNDRRPVWLHRCENCLACYNWCPRHAIKGGISNDGFYYRHPEVSAEDLINA